MYRFDWKTEESFLNKKPRTYHNDHQGGAQQFHYTVQTEDDYYCGLLFDDETLSWRFIEVKKEGFDLLKLDSDGKRVKDVELPV